MTSERKNITQPTDWWAAFEAAAQAEGVSLSEWVGACCRAKVTAVRLSTRPTVGAPKKLDEDK